MASSTVYSFAAGVVVVVVVVVVRRTPLDTSEVKPSSRTPLPSTTLRPPLCGPGEVPSHSARRDPEDTKSTDSNSSLKSNPPPPGDDDDDRTPTPRDLFSFSSSSRSRDPNGFPVVVVSEDIMSKTFFESGGGKRLVQKRDFIGFRVLKRLMQKGLRV